MKKILILMGRYLPGYRDGGPIRTISNLVELLGDEYEFYIACQDRDRGDTKPYANIKVNDWNTVGKAKVWYVPEGRFSIKTIKMLSSSMDIIYLCGFFDDYGYKTLLLNRFGMLPVKKVVIAPLGIFSAGALAQKPIKKKVFFAMSSVLGLFNSVVWSFSTEIEKDEAKPILGDSFCYYIAENCPSSRALNCIPQRTSTEYLKTVFISRISPKKNLITAIKALNEVNSQVVFDIYGPVEDKEYWRECERELNGLPANVKWHYCGELEYEQVSRTFGEYDVFLFPTLGENYGHVIFEALSAGCVPIISDQTPWNIIAEKKAGFVIPISESAKEYAEPIDYFASLDDDSREQYSKNAVEVAKERLRNNIINNGYRLMFENLS